MKYRFRRLDGRVEVKQHISERTLNSMSKVYWKFDIKILKKKELILKFERTQKCIKYTELKSCDNLFYICI
jgi:hypothetical protein